MFKRLWAPAALLTVLVCASAQAAPVTVNLRVEGSTATIFEGPVTTDGRTVDGGDGTGPHPCDGTNGGRYPTPGGTMTSALADAGIPGGFTATWNVGLQDFLVSRVQGDTEDLAAGKFWGIGLNFGPPKVGDAFVGGCQKQVKAGDEVLFGHDFFSKAHLLKLEGPARASIGEPMTVSVTDGQDNSPVDGATLAGADAASVTDLAGRASVSFGAPGIKRLKADRQDSLRSNALEVCVEQPGTNACAGFVSPLASTKPNVSDSTAPIARISGPRHGRRYRRGPRLLKGTVADDPSGVREVKLALRRHVRGRSCQWWSGRRERFVGTHCRKVFFFSIGNDRRWSYLMPRALPPGRYVLDVKAFDGRRNRDERFVNGRNRIVFDVLKRAARRQAGGRGRGGTGVAQDARARSSGSRVQVMVVGKAETLVEAATLRARATVVRASGRACKVAASTPLAALAAALRPARTGWHVRDFGSCKRRSGRSSGQLFVDRVAKDRNRGQDGWVYKVNDRAGTVGAADTSGRRLRGGDRVVWFYCVLDPAAKGCQRTLRVSDPGAVGAPGTPLRVKVLAYDDARRSIPANGARVTLGGAVVSAGPDGVATLPVPAHGPHALVASWPGAVPSFPIRIGVP